MGNVQARFVLEEQEKYKTSLEHFVAPECKKLPPKRWGHVKRTETSVRKFLLDKKIWKYSETGKKHGALQTTALFSVGVCS